MAAEDDDPMSVIVDTRRDQILDGARRLLGKNGMQAFTIRNVASEAQVSLALVIYHFGGTDGLLEAVYMSVMFELSDMEEFTPANPKQAADNRLLVVADYFDPRYFSRESLLIWLPLFERGALDEEFRRKIDARDEAYVSRFAVHISRVIEFRELDLDPMVLARNLMSFMDGLWLRWCHSNRPETRDEHRAALDYLEGKVGSLIDFDR